jgi:hypothetical protein
MFISTIGPLTWITESNQFFSTVECSDFEQLINYPNNDKRMISFRTYLRRMDKQTEV